MTLTRAQLIEAAQILAMAFKIEADKCLDDSTQRYLEEAANILDDHETITTILDEQEIK
jgi:hypothetical protein